ncbi:MAG: hypothetical protein FWD69_10230 [Polyangiaceae bacterium]|nr:hypothetical protein [Polyangiaceae bacterium]
MQSLTDFLNESEVPVADHNRSLVLVASAIARTMLDLFPEGEVRPLHAIEAAERWARGEDVSSDELRDAHDAACKYAYDAHVSVIHAATASAEAARAARAACSSDGHVVLAVANAARQAAYGLTSTRRMSKEHIAIVRKYFPSCPESLVA